jgi:feruloyl esterase
LSILWDYMAVWHKPERVIGDAELTAMHAAVLKSCGRASEPFLREPLSCHWRPEELLCRDNRTPCLTPAQVEAANLIYDGPKNPRTGERYMEGLPRGSEVGWTLYMRQTASELPFRGVFATALGEHFQFGEFDWDRDADTFIALLAPAFDAMNLNMRQFVRRGGKILMYHGGADPLAPVRDTVDFARSVKNEMVDAALSEASFNSAMRLFVLPGVGHCRGGEGPDQFDALGAIRTWVERGTAPAQLEVSSRPPNTRTEHLVPYDLKGQ